MSFEHDLLYLKRLVLRWYEIHDRPCEPNGNWPHVDEYQEVDTELRSLVTAPARVD